MRSTKLIMRSLKFLPVLGLVRRAGRFGSRRACRRGSASQYRDPRDRRNDRRRRLRRSRVHLRSVQGRGPDCRSAGNRQARKPEGRAGREHRQPGHERSGLAQARPANERAASRPTTSTHRRHARHRHDGGDRVLPRSRGQERQAGRARRLDASGDRGQRRWSGQPLRCGRDGDPIPGAGPRRARRHERHRLQRARRRQDEHDEPRDVRQSNRGPPGQSSRRQGDLVRPEHEAAHQRQRVPRRGTNELPRVDIIYAHSNMDDCRSSTPPSATAHRGW